MRLCYCDIIQSIQQNLIHQLYTYLVHTTAIPKNISRLDVRAWLGCGLLSHQRVWALSSPTSKGEKKIYTEGLQGQHGLTMLEGTLYTGWPW